jgi:hypothetical protein
MDNETTGSTDETQKNENDIMQNNTLETTKNTNANNSNNSLSVESDTPSSLLSMSDIDDNVYASKAIKANGNDVIDQDEVTKTSDSISKNEEGKNTIHNQSSTTNNTDTDSNTTNNTTNNIDENITNNTTNTSNVTVEETNIITENGFEIPLSDLLIKYRDTFLNIDMMIIKELKPCFMMIY